MKYFPLIPLALVPSLYAQDVQTHQDFALSLLDLLAELELSLSQCQDEQSVKDQLDTLKELSVKTADLAEMQKKMDNPIIADYIAAEKHVAEFNMLCEAIANHVQRLKELDLYTQELETILKI